MKEQLDKLRQEAVEAIESAASLDALEAMRIKYLGRKGTLTDILRGVSQLSPEERPTVGKLANEVKGAVSEALESRKATFEDAAESKGQPALDLTLPGRKPPRGHLHPVASLMNEITDIFAELGFKLATGPDIETEYYNFDSLNTPPDHPARDSHDTFFVKPGVVLRTHTSPVQMRVMEKVQPPVAVVAPGRVYRVDADATHSPMFCQVEGLLVDEGVTFAELKGTLLHFIHKLFGPNVKARFRPHFFPFTEPSAEVDIYWEAGSRSRWLEMLGCGMVHPEVFRHAGYDSEKYTGYAFGMGVDRIAMVRHAIDSIHHLYENDLRFLRQF
jgi:phenylalanyl-tRNA synthetase alpha chain